MSSPSSNLPDSVDNQPDGDAEPEYRMIPVVMTLGADARIEMGSGINTEDILDIWSPDNNKNMLEELKAGLGSTLKIMKRPFDIGSGQVEFCRMLELADTLEAFFGLSGDITSINQAIEYRSVALSLTPENHPKRPRQLTMLGRSFYRRFERFAEVADADKAIEYHTQAVLLTPDDDTRKASRLTHLGHSHFSRFEQLGELADIQKAIESHVLAVLLTPDEHEEKPGRLNNVAGAYMRRFDYFGELADLEKSIEYDIKAVLLAPDGHMDKPSWLANTGISYELRFGRLGELADVDKAIMYLTQAVLASSDGDAGKLGRLESLGSTHLSRFERLGELEDVHKAMQYQTEAVLLTPDTHEAKPHRLNSLAVSYLYRFESVGELADVDMSIEYQTQTVLLTPDGHASMPMRLTNLGNAYRSRFERLGELADVDKAIECQTQSMILTPDDDPEKANLIQNLGISCLRRFEHLGELVDIEKAVDYQTQAVLLTPDGHSDKPNQLNNLGGSCLRRFERLKDLADVDKAIKYLTQAVLFTPDGYAGKPARLCNLGNAHLLRFGRLGKLADLDGAIVYQTQAVELIPDGHAVKPTLLFNLGNSSLSRFKELGNNADLECALSTFKRAAEHDGTNPKIKIDCSRRWVRACKSLNLSPLPAYERCMALIPHVVWLGTTIDQRYTFIATISDLVTEAAAWAVSAQAFDLAVEWLEQGRSIVWNQVLQLRTPLDDLAVADAALAQRLNDIAGQLESAGNRPSDNASLDPEKEAQRHRRLAEEWDQLLGQVRNIPGFEHFMRPRTADQLKLAATDGPVVVINTHTTRCDALIILPQCDEITHIPLDTVLLTKLSNLRVQLDSLLVHRDDRAGGFKRSNPPKAQDHFRTMLATLWSDIVKPVLDSLALMVSPLSFAILQFLITQPKEKLGTHELPHITWCTTGVLSFLPLHAAGCYDGSHNNAFNHCISSYTPTIGVLLAQTGSVSDPDFGVLAVGQEHTEGLSSLPSTVRELAVIQEHTKARRFQKLDCENATVDAVLSAMDEYSWVHLACHATQDSVNPAHSAFHLHDGNLTLETITKRQFKNKGLAFLSACQTAKGDGKLPDEVVHLAAGMLMAGYPSVIATMWSIADVDGPEVAGRVYAELLRDGKMGHRGAAKALHTAVAELQEKIGEDSFERWVPFIHIGV